MSGHNKWSTIKHKKAAVDAKKGKVFTKISKELTVAARIGGGDPGGNPRLRLAIATARAASMPQDNVQRAIKKGTGELEGGQIEELVYEGYGPGGVAFIVEVATDNTNRTLTDVRSALEKTGGSFAKSGAVSFLFNRRGVVRVEAKDATEDRLMELTLDAGAEDIVNEDGYLVIYTSPASLLAVKEALDAANVPTVSAEVARIPTTTVTCDVNVARKTIKLVERLEESEDVQNVWANYDISDDVMKQLEQEA